MVRKRFTGSKKPLKKPLFHSIQTEHGHDIALVVYSKPDLLSKQIVTHIKTK